MLQQKKYAVAKRYVYRKKGAIVMKPLNVFVVIGLACIGLNALAIPGQTQEGAVEQAPNAERLNSLEEELSVEDYNSADSILELDPVSVGDQLVDVEIFSNPEPNRRIETFNEEFDREPGNRGVEIIEFSLPI